MLVVAVAVAALGAFAPGPIEGVWSSRMLACMCNSRNLVEFSDGRAIMSSGHLEMRGPNGSYAREDGAWVWRMRGADDDYSVRVEPTWFFIRFVDASTGDSYRGHRLWWPPSIRRARAEQVVPAGAPADSMD
jgi:hypothetical protein